MIRCGVVLGVLDIRIGITRCSMAEEKVLITSLGDVVIDVSPQSQWRCRTCGIRGKNITHDDYCDTCIGKYQRECERCNETKVMHVDKSGMQSYCWDCYTEPSYFPWHLI